MFDLENILSLSASVLNGVMVTRVVPRRSGGWECCCQCKEHGPRDCGSPLEPAASGSPRRDTRLGPLSLFTSVCSPSSAHTKYTLPSWSFRRLTMKAISLQLLQTPVLETTPFSTTHHPPFRTTCRPRPTINHWLDKNERGRGTLWQTDESAWKHL